MSLGPPNGTAGTIYYHLVLTNKSSVSCQTGGFPGVSFVTGDSGTQVGAPAQKNGSGGATLTLSPGASVHAQLGVAEASNFPDCRMTAIRGLRVYPPNQTAALFVGDSDQACANTKDQQLTVGPLVAGS